MSHFTSHNQSLSDLPKIKTVEFTVPSTGIFNVKLPDGYNINNSVIISTNVLYNNELLTTVNCNGVGGITAFDNLKITEDGCISGNTTSPSLNNKSTAKIVLLKYTD